ncbi:UDP-N-acetylglucosamine 2-epimerase [Clostridium sp. HBUAS56017]|uniref:UDP-N-acetylglucosamine 2-epimerase n=1 Tax=Clostridium sp. HBUAS56017 TaxID=2571128 RepID=UPI0011780DA6|nr:UDP-N-acetylglucosamine 2-epimerase [Clostridium sp. HBUAS56017]
MKKIIGVVTSTRAEYGLLKPIILALKKYFDVKVIATGTHLSNEFGMTAKMIEEDGVIIDEKVEILLSSDTNVGICKSMGLAMISFGELFERSKFDALLVLGDRYEIFSIAAAANVSQIPIFHMYGGETTEGAFDEAFRHSISKMSYLHFTSTKEYRSRVIQLGENPARVFHVGAIGIENIKKMKLMDKNQLEKSIEFVLDKPFFLVTFHPATLEKNSAKFQFKELLEALSEYKYMKIIFTKANSDTNGRIINDMIDDYVANNENCIEFTSMGQVRYLSAMKYCIAVIGNSSSGIIEAPSFKIPTINIGDRQKGRIQGESIINCNPEKNEIVRGINKAISKEFNKNIENINNPYGDGEVSNKVLEIIKKVMIEEDIELKKVFYDLS